MIRFRMRSATLCALLLLGSCGGGGTSDSGPPPPPPPQANRAPVFTSGSSASVAENSGGTVYSATATDADGNALSYSLSGGADMPAFRITSAGVLSFAATPDFEAPTDANGDNIYLVDIQVSDGTASATQAVSVTVTNGGNDAFRVRRVATGLTEPVGLTPVPDGSGRVFVLQRRGFVRILNPATGASTLFLDISSIVNSGGEGGLLGFAIAPDFATSGVFYVDMINSARTIEIRRYTTITGNRDRGNAASGDVIMAIPHAQFGNHFGGWIGFGPDGMLYITTGDGGGSGDPNGNGQNTAVLLGKLLRIDVRSDAFAGDPLRDYAIPAGNPFATSGGAPEIWAYGLRNAFRNSFDPVSGFLMIGDVGEGAMEEIDLMRPTDGGANFGWNFREGTRTFTSGSSGAGLTAPVAEYPHGNGPTQGNSVIGGYVYRGPVEALQGQYFFADFISTHIWSLPLARLALGQTVPASQFTIRNFTPDAGSIGMVSSFGVDQSNNLYILDFDGDIFVIEPD